MRISDIFYKPLVTEKAIIAGQASTYVFHVNTKANKCLIARAVESMYKVKVGEVRVINRKGKVKKRGKKMIQRQLPTMKLAVVKLKEGSIPVLSTN